MYCSCCTLQPSDNGLVPNQHRRLLPTVGTRHDLLPVPRRGVFAEAYVALFRGWTTVSYHDRLHLSIPPTSCGIFVKDRVQALFLPQPTYSSCRQRTQPLGLRIGQAFTPAKLFPGHPVWYVSSLEEGVSAMVRPMSFFLELHEQACGEEVILCDFEDVCNDR